MRKRNKVFLILVFSAVISLSFTSATIFAPEADASNDDASVIQLAIRGGCFLSDSSSSSDSFQLLNWVIFC